MTDLVTNYRADSAIIYSWVRIATEKGRLQDCGWEYDAVGERRVICIHRLRQHAPFGRINWFVQICQSVFARPSGGIDAVRQGVITGDLKALIGLEYVRITDHRYKAVKFCLGLLQSGFCHPLVFFQRGCHGELEIAHQGLHPGFAFRREVALNIERTELFTQLALNSANRPFPTRTLLFTPGNCAAEEIEIGIVQFA